MGCLVLFGFGNVEGQNIEGDGVFDLVVNVQDFQGNTGSYIIDFIPNFNGPVDDNCEVIFQLVIDYFDDNDNLIYSYAIPNTSQETSGLLEDNYIGFHGQEEAIELGWYPTNLEYQYIVTPPLNIYISNIDRVELTVNIDWSGCVIGGQITTVSYTVIHNENELFNYFCNALGGNCDDPIQNATITETPTFYNGNLGFQIYEYIIEGTEFYNCNFGQMAYAIPYGGVPPYTHIWESEDGEIFEITTFEQFFPPAYAPNIFMNPNGDNATFFLTVTDAEGNTAGPITHTFQDVNTIILEGIQISYEEIGCSAKATATIIGGSGDYNVFVDKGSITINESSITVSTEDNGPHTITVLDYFTRCRYDFTIVFNSLHLNPFIDGIYATCGEGQSTLLSVSQPYNSFQWFYNGEPIPDEISSTLQAELPGKYRVDATSDESSCMGSTEIIVTFSDPPTPIIIFDCDTENTLRAVVPSVGFGSEAPSIYKWFKNGALLAEGDFPTIDITSNGVYQVEVIDVIGCSEMSNVLDINHIGEQGEIVIDDIVTWDYERYINQNIRIKEGALLDIQNTRIVFAENTGIIVEKGGTLFTENSLLTHGCASTSSIADETIPPVSTNSRWNGITVEGNSNLNHPTFNYFLLYYVVIEQGIAHINNSEIENAKVAIQTDSNNAGGIIVAESSIFENNDQDIIIDYRNGVVYDNRSTINNCTFHKGQNTDFNVELYKVRSIDIINNRFFVTANYSSYEYALYNQGFGLLLDGCSFDLTDNYFDNYFLAVDCNGFNQAALPDISTVKENRFTGNTRGMQIAGGYFYDITENHFRENTLISDPPLPPNGLTYSMLIAGTYQFNIYENNFTGDLKQAQSHELIVSESSMMGSGSVDDNYFNLGVFGLQTQGNNNALDVQCNIFDTDYPLASSWVSVDGSLKDQGNCEDNPMGNEWHNLAGLDIKSAIDFEYHPFEKDATGSEATIPYATNPTSWFSANVDICTNLVKGDDDCTAVIQKLIDKQPIGDSISRAEDAITILNTQLTEQKNLLANEQNPQIATQVLRNISYIEANIRGLWDYKLKVLIRRRNEQNLLNALHQDPTLVGKKRLLDYYLRSNDLSTSRNLLTTLENWETPPASHLTYLSFMDLLLGIQESNRSYTEMTTSELTLLQNIANSPTSTAMQADMLLHRLNNQQYLHPVKEWQSANKSIFATDLPKQDLSVQPNPSNSSMLLRWDDTSHATQLVVYDTFGNLRYAEKLSPKSTETRLNVSEWSEGIYFCILRNSSQQNIYSTKIMVH